MPDSAYLTPLAEAIALRAPKDGIFETDLPHLGLVRASNATAPTHLLQEPALCVIAQGTKRIRVGDEELVYDVDRFLLASLDLPIAGEVIEASPERPYLALRLSIDLSTVAELAAGMPEGAGHALGLSVHPIDAGIRDALARLLSLLDTPEHLATLAPLVEREILYRLLIGPQGARLREIALGRGGANGVARVVEIMRRDYARPLRVESLAREVGMSVSGLHHHFKALTAMSPLQFQKRLRLHEAQRMLLSEGLDAASVALRVGYESPSQFSREYRRLFGAPPIQHVSAVRRDVRAETVAA